MIYLHQDIQQYLHQDQPLFAQMMALRGVSFRDVKGRLTQRISLGGKSYFIKQHHGVGWAEIVKNLIQGRWPVLSARNEWQALLVLQEHGIKVPRVMGYGVRGLNPAKLESFVVMEDISPALSLEDLCQQTAPSFNVKRSLLMSVATIAKKMHALGINHRDFYICHFLLSDNQLFLIDLHRAEQRNKIPERWRIKDLAGLYFSSKRYLKNFSKHDCLRFVKIYTGKSLRDGLLQYDWEKVKQRGEKLYREH